MPANNPTQELKNYNPLPTLELFHQSSAQIRCIVGPVGSGKTSAAAMECCYYLPFYLFKKYGIKHTRGVVVRNTYSELMDTTMHTVFEWFPWGKNNENKKTFHMNYENGIGIEVLYRSCDNPDDIKKFKSLEVTWYWIDESIEVADEIKRMLKNRIGRYPSQNDAIEMYKRNSGPIPKEWFIDGRETVPISRYGIETTNPPDVEHPTYSEFRWVTPIPGPLPEKPPLENHVGFWQPPYENVVNLRPGYYDDLKNDYRDNQDWAEMYVLGHPGVIVRGKLVYANFRRDIHVAKEPLIWNGGVLFRGWDNSGNTPAALVTYVPTVGRWHILREFTTDRDGIVDFTRHVVESCNMQFPRAKYVDWGDPAGANKFSKKEGGFTSNAQLMFETAKVEVLSSDQNFTARVQAIDQQLGQIDGVLIDPSCTRLINGFLGGYCYPLMGSTGEYNNKPEKNRFSHVHDAGQYIAVKLFQSEAKKSDVIPYSHRNITSSPDGQGWMGR